ncbi:H+transporting two-sector ATPase subunit gamma [Stappia sp. 22II-S9-Z10]|nr:H+transporting two-sector ATPase subunit gamma [Stappia sp. 22II-S9-Z10]
MAERHADIAARITLVGQLQAVVTAMRGIAAARAQHARSLLPAIDAFSRQVADAIGRASSAAGDGGSGAGSAGAPGADGKRSRRPAEAGTVLIAFCAEEGFAGAFSERILDAATASGAPRGGDHLIVVGTRGIAAAHERGLEVAASAAMPSRADEVERLASSLVDLLVPLLAAGSGRVDVLFTRQGEDGGMEADRRSVLPLDHTAFPAPSGGAAPLTTIAPAMLVERLAMEYVFAALCRAALHAFAAENEARLRAMAAARSNIEQRLAGLKRTERMLRQAEITSEIIELTAGAEAARG